MTTIEIIFEIRAGSLNREHLLALCDEHEQALAAMRQNAVDRDGALAEFRLARGERDALRADVARLVARNAEMEHQVGTSRAEIDCLDALIRNYQDGKR